MDDIHEKAAQGHEAAEAAASRIRDAWDPEVHLSGPGVFVEALPRPPHGVDMDALVRDIRPYLGACTTK